MTRKVRWSQRQPGQRGEERFGCRRDQRDAVTARPRAYRVRPLARNFRSRASGQVLTTCRGRTHPRWAIATP